MKFAIRIFSTVLMVIFEMFVLSQGIEYEHILSRSKDDFTPNLLGSSMLISSMEKTFVNIELVVRVGRRSAQTKLTYGKHIDFHPVFNKTGDWLVFDSDRDKKIAIWSLSLSSDKPELLIHEPGRMCFGAQISSDGEKILYNTADFIDPGWWSMYVIPPPTKYRDNMEILIRNLKTNKDKFITKGFLPSWNPDETKIAFSDVVGDQWKIFILDLSSFSRTQITSGKTNDFYPSWSKDGRWIAFSCQNDSGFTDICIVNVSTYKIFNLTKTPRITEGGPFWAEEGIYFHADNGENTPYDIAFIPKDAVSKAIGVPTLSKPFEEKQPIIKVLNSTNINKLAARTAELLKKHGITVAEVGNTKRERNLRHGKIYYKKGYKDLATKIALIIPGDQYIYLRSNIDADIIVILGRDTRYKW